MMIWKFGKVNIVVDNNRIILTDDERLTNIVEKGVLIKLGTYFYYTDRSNIVLSTNSVSDKLSDISIDIVEDKFALVRQDYIGRFFIVLPSGNIVHTTRAMTKEQIKRTYFKLLLLLDEVLKDKGIELLEPMGGFFPYKMSYTAYNVSKDIKHFIYTKRFSIIYGPVKIGDKLGIQIIKENGEVIDRLLTEWKDNYNIITNNTFSIFVDGIHIDVSLHDDPNTIDVIYRKVCDEPMRLSSAFRKMQVGEIRSSKAFVIEKRGTATDITIGGYRLNVYNNGAGLEIVDKLMKYGVYVGGMINDGSMTLYGGTKRGYCIEILGRCFVRGYAGEYYYNHIVFNKGKLFVKVNDTSYPMKQNGKVIARVLKVYDEMGLSGVLPGIDLKKYQNYVYSDDFKTMKIEPVFGETGVTYKGMLFADGLFDVTVPYGYNGRVVDAYSSDELPPDVKIIERFSIPKLYNVVKMYSDGQNSMVFEFESGEKVTVENDGVIFETLLEKYRWDLEVLPLISEVSKKAPGGMVEYLTMLL